MKIYLFIFIYHISIMLPLDFYKVVLNKDYISTNIETCHHRVRWSPQSGLTFHISTKFKFSFNRVRVDSPKGRTTRSVISLDQIHVYL